MIDIEEAEIASAEAEAVEAIKLESEIHRLRAELAATKEALKPFADLRVTRFMTDGLTYNFRVDAAWIRKARAVGGMEE